MIVSVLKAAANTKLNRKLSSGEIDVAVLSQSAAAKQVTQINAGQNQNVRGRLFPDWGCLAEW
jgi:hypothetical protein